MNWRSKTGLALITCALILAMLTSCAPAATPGEEVTVGLGATMTGAIASTGLPISYGVLDYLELVNEKGGIDGVKLNVIWEETAALIPRSIIAHRRFVRAGAVADIYLISGQAEAMTAFAPKDEIPSSHESYLTAGMRTDPEPWVFAIGTGWSHMAGFMLKYAREQWTESRTPRVGILIYDQASAWDWANGVKKYAPELGFEIVGMEVVPFLGAIDTSVEWLRLAGEKPDWVILYAVGATLVVLIKDSARLDIQEKGIQIGMADPLDESIIPIVGADADGWYATRIFPMSSEIEFSGMNDLLEIIQRRHGWGPEKIGSMYFGGWLCAQYTVEGIRLAIEEVGLENLNGRAVRDGLTRIKDFDTGLMSPRLSYHKESPYFHKSSRIMHIQGEKIVPVIDWQEVPYQYEWY